MKHGQHVVGEAARIEVDNRTGKLFIIFEITDEKCKQEIVKTWTDDIEFIIINKSLVQNDND